MTRNKKVYFFKTQTEISGKHEKRVLKLNQFEIPNITFKVLISFSNLFKTILSVLLINCICFSLKFFECILKNKSFFLYQTNNEKLSTRKLD